MKRKKYLDNSSITKIVNLLKESLPKDLKNSPTSDAAKLNPMTKEKLNSDYMKDESDEESDEDSALIEEKPSEGLDPNYVVKPSDEEESFQFPLSETDEDLL